MDICPHCEFSFQADRELTGSRCPSCHDPLYEPPSRITRRSKPGEPVCAVHPESESLGTCTRCRKNYCETCRCRWQDQIVCFECVKKILQSAGGHSTSGKMDNRETMISILSGFLAVFFVAFAIFVIKKYQLSGGDSETGFGFILFMLYLLIALFSIFAIGMGSSVVRGNRLRVMIGLQGIVLGGICIAFLMANMAWNLWLL